MAPRTVSESRYDFRGALNLAFTLDSLDATELRLLKNARAGRYAGIETRPSTQRIHVNPIGAGAPVLGLYQFRPASGTSLIAVSNGNLYHRASGATEFTEVAGTLSTTARPSFQPHIAAGSPNLFIADGSLRKWDGTNLTTVADAPDAVQLAVYKTRMFALDGSKTVYWSRISNPEDWAFPNGGQGNVETYDASPIVALGVTGASLLLFKQNSIARFTGVSAENIRIDQETEGVSSDVGTIAPGTVVRAEDVLFFLTDRGPYIASEAGVQAVGPKVEPAFDDAEMDHMANAVAVYNHGTREVWVFFPENEETTNNVGYCFNMRTQGWYGPWDMGDQFDVCSATRFELPNGRENVVLGGYDGLVRLGAVEGTEALDDILEDGTGGQPIQFEADFGEMLFRDPSATKRLRVAQHLAMDLGVGGHPLVTFTTDLSPRDRVARLVSSGPGAKQYMVRPNIYGRRLGLRVRDQSGERIRVNGLQFSAEVSRRQV